MTTDAGFIPGFLVIHGNQAESLRDVLLQWMAAYPPAPLERDVVITQSNGIAQWLNFSLASQDEPGLGIAAGVDTVLPARFLWRCYRAVLGAEAVPEVSPLDKPRLVWRLMRLLPDLVGAPGYDPLQRFLQNDPDQRRLLQLSQRLADLYDQYQVYRADWLAAWAAGDEVLINAAGQRSPLGDNLWQARLWQSVLADIAADPNTPSGPAAAGRAAVHQAFVTAAQASGTERPRGLPRRVFVFGLSSLPAQSLEVLGAIARWCQVILCVQNPCQYHWADIIEARWQERRATKARQRHDSRPHDDAHPLLAAWGRQGRDFMSLLAAYDDPAAREAHLPALTAIGQAVDVFTSPGEGSVLQQLQDDVLALRPLAETQSRWGAVDPAQDHSLRFHIAHSPQREVEILHDRLLGAFEADPSLQPRDCLVMVPDIMRYAPHIEAVFGLHAAQDDPRAIAFSIADQGQRGRDPIIQALEQLLRLGQSRTTLSEVLDLLEVPALRRRFGIEETDIPRLHRWVARANVRWGLHAEQARTLGLPGDQVLRHTWRHGLRRLLLGYATGADAQPWQDIEPQGEVGGLEAALLGPLEQLLGALDALWAAQQDSATVADWVGRWRQWLGDFFAPETRAEQASLLALESALRDWLEAVEAAQFHELLPATVVAECWVAGLDQASLSQRFFGGAVTFATLMPMRAIPFRFVALLGMNDGDYPRARAVADFDLMAMDYRPGDRSRREDDRYLFLEAVLSAREHLHCSWVGRSVTDNTPRSPSVLVGQLRDHLAAGWRLAGVDQPDSGRALVDALTIDHPLQPFSTRYFTAAEDGLYTYAREWRQGKEAALSLPPGVAPDDRLPPPDIAMAMDLAGLRRFLRDPVKAWFEDRLGVVLNQRIEAIENDEPFALNALDRWQMARDLMDQAEVMATQADGDDWLETAIERRVRRGDLPAAGVGRIQAEAIGADLQAALAQRDACLADWPVALPERWVRYPSTSPKLEDRLRNLHAPSPDADTLLQWRLEPGRLYDSRPRYDRMVDAWLAHLLANATVGFTQTQIFSVAGHAELAPLESEQAAAMLDGLLALWLEGMTRPLPMAPRTAFAWLAKENDEQAAKAYEGDDFNLGERMRSPYLARVYPDYAALVASGEFYQQAQAVLDPLKQFATVQKGSAE